MSCRETVKDFAISIQGAHGKRSYSVSTTYISPFGSYEGGVIRSFPRVLEEDDQDPDLDLYAIGCALEAIAKQLTANVSSDKLFEWDMQNLMHETEEQ